MCDLVSLVQLCATFWLYLYKLLLWLLYKSW